MNAVDQLAELIIGSINDTIHERDAILKGMIRLEILRIKTSAFNAGKIAGRKEEADRIKEYGDKFSTGPETTMKTRQGLRGTLYSLDSLTWFSTPETAQASHDKRQDR